MLEIFGVSVIYTQRVGNTVQHNVVSALGERRFNDMKR